MDYDKLGFMATMAGFLKDYSHYGLQGNTSPDFNKWLAFDGPISNLEVYAQGDYTPRSPKLKQEFSLFDRKKSGRKRLRTGVAITPSLNPNAPVGSVAATVFSRTGKYTDAMASRALRESAYFDSLTPKQALALIENIKKNPELADLMSSEAFYNKAHEVDIKPDQVKKVLDKWFDPSGLNLKPGTPIRLFDGPEYKEVQKQRLLNRDKLKALLKVRKFRNLGLLTVGAGATGTAGSLLDNKDRMLSAGLSTAAGAAALPTGLAAFGGKKLNRLMTRKPLVGLAAGALGGLGGFFGNKTIQDSLQKESG